MSGPSPKNNGPVEEGASGWGEEGGMAFLSRNAPVDISESPAWAFEMFLHGNFGGRGRQSRKGEKELACPGPPKDPTVMR